MAPFPFPPTPEEIEESMEVPHDEFGYPPFDMWVKDFYRRSRLQQEERLRDVQTALRTKDKEIAYLRKALAAADRLIDRMKHERGDYDEG